MLSSLFGDLDPLKPPSGEARDSAFAATAILETVATQVNSRGQIIDRHSHELVVSGSPAQAIRGHFADTRADLETATSLITLLDPAGVWASAVIRALSDAGGRPIERLQLREHGTLRSLATIERTTLVRRHEETLRIYHADVRAPGPENAEIPVALMERSQMSTVIVGPLQAHAIDALLAAILLAAMLPTWRCPHLLFMLPPNASWIAHRIQAMAWPGRLHVHVLSESMTGASSVWNAMLGTWNQVKAQTGWGGLDEALPDDFSMKVAELGVPVAPTMSKAVAQGAPAAALQKTKHGLDPLRIRQALAAMAPIEGLLGYAVADASTGLVLAREAGAGVPELDMELSAAAASQVLRAHRAAARSLGLAAPIDEIMTSAGSRQLILRYLSRRPDLFLVAILDRQRTNLALARFQLIEVERMLTD